MMSLDQRQLQQYLVHRPPFLMVDRVLEVESRKYARGYRNISVNEWFFQGHFPGYPVMPGVLIAEALAQLAAVAENYPPEGTEPDKVKPRVGYLGSFKDFTFKSMAVPGDRLDLEVWLKRHIGRAVIVEGKATIEDRLVASGTMIFVMEE